MSVAQASDPTDPGKELVDFWNEILVPKFTRFKHILVGGLTHHSEAIFPSLPVKQGERVLDVGCGFGDTAIQLARRVGPQGAVTGIDCCDAFLEFGRKDAAAAGLSNVTFIEGDVQSHAFEPVHDFVFSRFGTMFFENPVVGLRNMRTALKPGGLMTMIVWRSIDDNPWLGLPKQVVLEYLPQPGADARTCGPGPFSMADREMVTAMLKSAGYVDPAFKRVDAPVLVGATTQDSMDFQLALGPAGEVFREAGELAEQRRAEIEAALSEAISAYQTDEGIAMASSSWVITAANPG
ncbi:class I SAM-dependent methyltransferase [Pelagibius sp.]|uniref:class I SAM-dependent methyltransferase n=1 Tax=Pelagibius sp. TaxID=1931238 RepID=UPI0026165629|nr:class I SAM-dependent methyltransferase [Pelagibius sp.]